jgi:phage terminase small subunit
MSEPITRARRTRQPPLPQTILTPAQPAGKLTPLQWLLHVVNDPSASEARRDKAAIAAAPYCHPRPLAVGKKQRAASEAKAAGTGTEWGSDLDPSNYRSQ